MKNNVIDITPTWAGMLQPLLVLLLDGDHEGKKLAREELAKMAKVADLYNASIKGGSHHAK